MLGVRARGVQLVSSNAGRVVESFDHANVVPYLIAEDVGNAGSAGVRAKRGKLFFDKGLNPDILQPDGVDHAPMGLDQPRCRVARHGLQGQALGDKATDPAKVDNVFKLNAIAKSSAGREDRIAEQKTGKTNAHIRLHGLVGPSWEALGGCPGGTVSSASPG